MGARPRPEVVRAHLLLLALPDFGPSLKNSGRTAGFRGPEALAVLPLRIAAGLELLLWRRSPPLQELKRLQLAVKDQRTGARARAMYAFAYVARGPRDPFRLII